MIYQARLQTQLSFGCMLYSLWSSWIKSPVMDRNMIMNPKCDCCDLASGSGSNGYELVRKERNVDIFYHCFTITTWSIIISIPILLYLCMCWHTCLYSIVHWFELDVTIEKEKQRVYSDILFGVTLHISAKTRNGLFQYVNNGNSFNQQLILGCIFIFWCGKFIIGNLLKCHERFFIFFSFFNISIMYVLIFHLL